MIEQIFSWLKPNKANSTLAADTEFEAAQTANSAEDVLQIARQGIGSIFFDFRLKGGQRQNVAMRYEQPLVPAYFGTELCFGANVIDRDITEFHKANGVILDRARPGFIRPSERLMQKLGEAHQLSEHVDGAFQRIGQVNNPWWESVRLIDAAEKTGMTFDAKAVSFAQAGNNGDVAKDLAESLTDLRNYTGGYAEYEARMQKTWGMAV